MISFPSGASPLSLTPSSSTNPITNHFALICQFSGPWGIRETELDPEKLALVKKEFTDVLREREMDDER